MLKNIAVVRGPSAFLLVLTAWVTASAADAPNVVLIISDDQAWTDFSFMGHRAIQTPNLDCLARQSALFERGYVPTSLCRPSLATIISGLYPHQHKIVGNDCPHPAAMARQMAAIPKLPELLKSKGYRSFQTGKWWEGSWRTGGFTEGMTEGYGRHGDVGLKIGREGMKPIFDFIARCGDSPFFVWYAPFLPHEPHNAPQRFLEEYTAAERPIQIARYYATCAWLDETCGELLEFLDNHKLADNTLIVFVTDNGWALSGPNPDVDGPNDLQAKGTSRDLGIRTPIMLRWPGHFDPGRYQTPVGSIDIAPTILAAADLKPPAAMAGRNLMEIALAGGKFPPRPLFGASFEVYFADVDNPSRSLRSRWCIDGDLKLILPAGPTAPRELYNLAGDPYETTNLAIQDPLSTQRLTRLADEWWTPASQP